MQKVKQELSTKQLKDRLRGDTFVAVKILKPPSRKKCMKRNNLCKKQSKYYQNWIFKVQETESENANLALG